MHMNYFPEQYLTKEYKLSISTKGGMRDKQMTIRRDKLASGNREHVHKKKTGVISQSTMWSRSFRRPGCAAEPVPEDFEEVGVLMTVPRALLQAKHGTC